MEGTRESEYLSAQSVAASGSATASSSSQYETADDESLCTITVEERIEASKSHWSELTSELTSELSDDDRRLRGEVAADNMKVFRTLQSHPEWGHFFWTFNDGSGNTLVVGEKFAEGGQAELYNAQVTFANPDTQQFVLGSKMKFALKVFKEGTILRDLQRQWPQGFLNWETDAYNRSRNQIVSTPSRSYYSVPWWGTMLEGGRFAFFMTMLTEDLRNQIVRRMKGREYGCAPFSKKQSDVIMYKIALGLLWLHEHDVVHRDMKASNVLIGNGGDLYVADYECSIGVVGTGYWRAPEILQACKERTVSQQEELFTKAADVYSYAMTCYEILTGKDPFEDELVTTELVIGGQRPTLQTFVDDWAQQLLQRCWDTNPSSRPSIQEILTIIASNTNIQWIKAFDVVQKRTKVTDVERFNLGCDNLLHTFAWPKSGIFNRLLSCITMVGSEIFNKRLHVFTRFKSGIKCELCFETWDEYMTKCTTCTNFYLHSECAALKWFDYSFIHSHGLEFCPAHAMSGIKRRCDGCQLDIGEESWYRCPVVQECDFDLHLLCAKYVGRISHPLHKEHKFVLSSSSSSTSLKDSNMTCECCGVQFNPMEFIYHCEECAFNIHPKCAVPNLQVHRH